MWMDIRGRIHRECNLQSIFPANDRKIVKLETNEFISRCMHERKEDCKESVADFIEDVVVKLRKFSDDETGQKAKQVRISTRFSHHLSSFDTVMCCDLTTGYSKVTGKVHEKCLCLCSRSTSLCRTSRLVTTSIH